MSLLTLLLFHLLLGSPLANNLLFTALAALGGTSLSIVFTFLSAIAAKAQQNASLMAILGFPIILPQLILLLQISAGQFNEQPTDTTVSIALMLGLDGLVILLTTILFPFLWKE